MAHTRWHHWLLLAACVGCWARGAEAPPTGQAGGRHEGRVVVEDFEALAWGEDWATVQFSPGADPRMKPERQWVRSGRQACRLDVPPGESLTLAPQHGEGFVGRGGKPPLPLPGSPGRVGLWVHGERSGHRLWLRLQDSAGKTAELGLGAVDFEGWRLLEARTRGADAPPLAPPLALAAILVRGGEGSLVLDDLTVAASASTPLYLRLRLIEPEGGLVEGEVATCRITIQSLDDSLLAGTGELLAHTPSGPGEKASDAPRAGFRYRVSAAEPFAATVRLRLPAGVYRLVAAAGEAQDACLAVVHPSAPRPPARARDAVRRFGAPGDAVRVYESALSPAVVVEAVGERLSLFRGLSEEGLSPPQNFLARTHPDGLELAEPWVLLWFGDAPAWQGVKLADGSPCPTFDVPFLVVLEQPPRSWQAKGGLELHFARPGARVAIMPLAGIQRATPGEAAGWLRDPDAMSQIVRACRFWTRLVRALPIAVAEECRVDAERDLAEVRVRFEYLDSSSRWGDAARRVAPVPPLLALARKAGLSVRFSKPPIGTGCATAVGPYQVVPDAEGYTYTISGLLRFVLSAVADVPKGVSGAQVSLARNYRSLSEDGVKIPYWVAYGGDAGRHAAEALTRYILAPANSRYGWDPATGRLRAWDGLAAEAHGDAAAAPLAAEALQACWYAGLHGGAWEALRRRWRHIEALRETLAGAGAWAALGLGADGEAADTRMDAALYFARLAAKLGGPDDFARGCTEAVRLMAAAYALAAAAPGYAEEFHPWPALAGRRKQAIGALRPGSIGFAPGPPPFLTTPSDAGYAFAAEFLGGYYREGFHGGPLDYFGRSPAEWSQRLFVTLAPPKATTRFRPAWPATGAFATNFAFAVEPGRDGWPAIVWHSHRAPAGGPLTFGSIGTTAATRGRLARTLTISPAFRLSAYQAIEDPPPPKEPKSQPPPAPEEPSS